MAQRPNAAIIGDAPNVIDSLANKSSDVASVDSGIAIENNAGDTISGYDTFDPADIGTGTGGNGTGGTVTGTGKRRGRPPGSTNGVRTAKTAVPKNLSTSEGIETMLMSIHLMGAAFFGTPELAMSPDEAKKLSEAIANVSQFYPLGVSPKTLAWLNLASVAGFMYGTRFVAITQRRKKEVKETKPVTMKPIAVMPQSERPTADGKVPPLTNASQLFGSAGIGVEDNAITE